MRDKRKAARDWFARVFCAAFRHSRIVTHAFWEVGCGRCGEKIGDTLASSYGLSDHVIIGHGCPRCEANYRRMTLLDKFMVGDPFRGRD